MLILLLLLLFIIVVIDRDDGYSVGSTLPPTIHITNKSARALNVNVWKSYRRTADKDVNMKATFAIVNTTSAVVKIRPEKIKPFRDLNPWPLWYW